MGKFLDWNYWSVSDCTYFQLLMAIRWMLCFAVPITSVLWQLAHLNLLCSLSQSGSSWRVEQSRWCKGMLFTHTVPQKRKTSANPGQKPSIKIMLCLKRFEFYSSIGIVQLKNNNKIKCVIIYSLSCICMLFCNKFIVYVKLQKDKKAPAHMIQYDLIFEF